MQRFQETPGMDDQKAKLEELKRRLGMMRGSELIRPADRPRKASRQEPPPIDPGEASSGGGGLLSEELRRQLRARMGLAATPSDSDPDEPMDIERALPGECVGDGESGFFLARRAYPLGHLVGDVPLGAALESQACHIAASGRDEALNAFDPRTACFMDTETTGLAGGAGTVAFLVGLGMFSGDGFVLEQCFLRDYDDEPAMLDYLAGRLQGVKTLVSYNGKSFDLPLLRSRFIQYRLPFPFADMAHYDLAHAARRVWKRRLDDCSLGSIEREILGLVREGDVPGFLIPRIWLDYLDRRDARPLRPVFYHHEMDILSLVALTGYLARRMAAENGPAFFHAEDQFSLARLYYKNKDYPAAVESARHFLEFSRAPDLLRRECLALLARAARRAMDLETMRETLEAWHGEFHEDCEAATELAKFRERQHRDIAGALRVCRETLAARECGFVRDALRGGFAESALRGRIKRLEKKRSGIGPELPEFQEEL